MNRHHFRDPASRKQALEEAQHELREAERDRDEAERRVQELLEELETARTICEVTQAVYDEKFGALLSLRDLCNEGGGNDGRRRSREIEPNPASDSSSVFNSMPRAPARAARRISCSNPAAAARLQQLGLLNRSLHPQSSGDEFSSFGGSVGRASRHADLSFAESARLVAQEEEEAIQRSQRLGKRNEVIVHERKESIMHRERIQRFNESIQFNLSSLTISASQSLSRPVRWLSSFRRLDPRYQILNFFRNVAEQGVDNIVKAANQPTFEVPALLKLLQRASAFSVWRPTSKDAIRKMMRGEATGKGLEIKGKSAKRGMLSSLVPFVQIYEEQHKERIRECVKDGTMRVFFPTVAARDQAAEMLNDVVEMMMFYVQDAMQVLSNPNTTPEEEEMVIRNLQWDGVDLGVIKIDDYARRGAFGVEITERLFWEAFVMMQDCSREPGSQYDTGRPSVPEFQDMNFKAIRHVPTEPGEPIPVVWQIDAEFPMSPKTLVMAYEEKGRVLPVVSDFDCFLVGTRGVGFDEPLQPDQIELVKWTVSKIESVLGSPESSETWTQRWLEVLKKEAVKGFYPKMPRFGFGDPKSYALMGCAVDRLRETGAVRHGAECFNYYFPQELDDEFLVICDTLPGEVPWKYVGVQELQKILIHKINDGHTFPLNPKWVLCDPGWKKVYDALMASDRRNVQKSLNIWFPPESGIREHIERVYAKHPQGFTRHRRGDSLGRSGTDSRDAMEFAELELERFVSRERGKRKIRAVVRMIALAHTLPSVKERERRESLERGHSWRPSKPSPHRRKSLQIARARASIVMRSPADVHHSREQRRDSGEAIETLLSSPPPRRVLRNNNGDTTRRGRTRRDFHTQPFHM